MPRLLLPVLALAAVAMTACGGEEASSPLRAATGGVSFSIYDWEPNVLGNRGPAAPFTARADALALAARSKAEAGRVAVVEDQRVPGQPSGERRWFVIEDDPALTLRDIAHPRAATDEITGEPTVTFRFTAAGRRRFTRLTAGVAARAARTAATHGATEASFQHFAIVVDGRILALPAVDAAAAPEGFDSPAAQINGVGSRREAKLLARRLG